MKLTRCRQNDYTAALCLGGGERVVQRMGEKEELRTSDAGVKLYRVQWNIHLGIKKQRAGQSQCSKFKPIFDRTKLLNCLGKCRSLIAPWLLGLDDENGESNCEPNIPSPTVLGSDSLVLLIRFIPTGVTLRKAAVARRPVQRSRTPGSDFLRPEVERCSADNNPTRGEGGSRGTPKKRVKIKIYSIIFERGLGHIHRLSKGVWLGPGTAHLG